MPRGAGARYRVLIAPLKACWWVGAVLAWAVGIGWVSLLASPGIILLVVVVVTAGDSILCRLQAHDPAHPRSPRRWFATAGLTATSFAGVGLLLSLQTTGLWILLLLAATCPATISAVARRLTVAAPSRRPVQQASPSAMRASGSAAALDAGQLRWLEQLDPQLLEIVEDPHLCWLWRASFPMVAAATTPAQLAAIIDARRAYLDEIERRHATAFHRWLDSGARAASDPSRFLT